MFPFNKQEIMQFIASEKLKQTKTDPKKRMTDKVTLNKNEKQTISGNRIQKSNLSNTVKLPVLKQYQAPDQKKKTSVEYGLNEEETKIYGDRFILNCDKISLLGKGGFALVWLGNLQDKYVAVKQIAKQNDNQTVQREYNFYKNFFQTNQQIYHPGLKNLIEIIGVEQSNKDIWVIQELGGLPLSKTLYNIKGEFFKGERVYGIAQTEVSIKLQQQPNLFIELLSKIAQGIDLIFSQGFSHCDLKPENILMKDVNEVKIIDYGLSSAFKWTDHENLGMVTPEYMAPEALDIIQNWSSYQTQYSTQIEALMAMSDCSMVDIWSFGAIILDILVGVPHWLSYKGKIVRNGKTLIKTGLFATKGRDLDKIIQKQIQVVQKLDQIVKENCQFLRMEKRHQLADLLKQCLKINPKERLSPNEILESEFFVGI